MYALEAKKSEFLVHLDRFSKYLKYFRNLEKRSNWTKNSDVFASELGYSRIKIDHKIYHFIADSLLKDAVLTVGVNLRLCLLSLWSWHEKFGIWNKNLPKNLYQSHNYNVNVVQVFLNQTLQWDQTLFRVAFGILKGGIWHIHFCNTLRK